MPLKINSIQPDSANKRGFLNLWDSTPGGSNDQVQINVGMDFKGNETLSEADAMIKARAKQLLQEALQLL